MAEEDEGGHGGGSFGKVAVGVPAGRNGGRRIDRGWDQALAARRAAAVMAARPTIPAISSGLSDAPPTSAPSMPGSARNSAMFALVTLPP